MALTAQQLTGISPQPLPKKILNPNDPNAPIPTASPATVPLGSPARQPSTAIPVPAPAGSVFGRPPSTGSFFGQTPAASAPAAPYAALPPVPVFGGASSQPSATGSIGVSDEARRQALLAALQSQPPSPLPGRPDNVQPAPGNQVSAAGPIGTSDELRRQQLLEALKSPAPPDQSSKLFGLPGTVTAATPNSQTYQAQNIPENQASMAPGTATPVSEAARRAQMQQTPPSSGPPEDFITQWQQSHPPDLNALLEAMKAAGYNVDHYYYGSTPSGNELMLNGQKYKVLNGDNATWYLAGTNDSGGGPGGGDLGAGGGFSALDPTVRDALLGILQTPTSIDEKSLLSSPEAAAYRLASQRSTEQQRAQMAEQAAQTGTNTAGGFKGEIRGLDQAKSEGEAQFLGQLANQKLLQNRQFLVSGLQMALSAGDSEKARALQYQLAQLDAELRRQGFNLQETLANNQLGFDYTQLQTQANRDATLAMLGA